MAVKVREKPKGSGIWWVMIDHNGRRKAKKIGRDKKFAGEMAKKMQAKLTLGDLNFLQEETRTPTFKEYADIWKATSLPATCKVSTVEDYKRLLKLHVLPIFGECPVNEIKRIDVRKFLNGKIVDGYKSSTVTHMKNTISNVLNMAVDDEAIQVNPAHRVGKISKSDRIGKAMDPLNREEVALLLETIQAHYPEYYPLGLLLARTGVRIGEALGLKWGDIDFHGRFISIERSLSGSKARLETPKNGKVRKVDMSLQLADVLKHLQTERKREALKQGRGSVPEWVFVSNDGTPLNEANFRNRVFNKALEKTGLRKVRVHDLRHTYASLLIQNGESLPYIRDQLGHHSIKVTVDIYGHLAPTGNKNAVDRLDDERYEKLKLQDSKRA